MGANDAVHDEVAAKIAAHNAAILADLAKPRKRRHPTTTTRRGKKPTGIPGERPLFGGPSTRVESYGSTRRRRENVDLSPRVPVPMVRANTIRCVDCDHGLVVRSGKVICPKCGTIFGEPAALRELQRQFPGLRAVDPEDYR